MKKVILLDMDGTITPSRKAIEPSMVSILNEIIDAGFDLGIVSGSSMNYMEEQLASWDRWTAGCKKIHKYPVNGTLGLDMKKEYTDHEWTWLIHDIQSADRRMRLSLGGKYIRCPEEIIEYRGSAINWCPIGRDANKEQREEFINLDRSYNFRSKFAEEIKTRPLFHDKTVIKLGGQTSFDIFPRGWDKSYVFKDFEGFERIYFIGDKCEPMGNDYEGYILAGDFGIQTSGPRSTHRILSKILEGTTSIDKISPQVVSSPQRDRNNS